MEDGNRGVGVGVSGHEQIRAAVAVHVADRGTGVPARRVDPGRAGAFREGAVTVSPQERVVAVGGDVVARGRHVEIRVAVEVEVGGDAAAAPELQVRPRAAAHVLESAVHVVEERAAGETAALRPAGVFVVRIRVDDEEVEPAVVVVVDPAQAAAHHRLGLVAHAEVECALREVEPDLGGDILQMNAAERLGADRSRGGRCLRRPPGGDDQVAAVRQSELERAGEARRGAATLDRRAASRSTSRARPSRRAWRRPSAATDHLRAPG